MYIDWSLLQEQVTTAAYMCGRHLNSTACNLLANLCTLTLHSKVSLPLHFILA
jgi:hypothetical protein